MANLDRRQALRLLAGLGGLALLPLPTRATFAAELPEPLARFKESLDAQAAAQLGRAFLKRHPDEADRGRLLEEILEGAEIPADWPAQLARKVRADFAAGRVVDLNDWQVSATEARIFAAIALTA